MIDVEPLIVSGLERLVPVPSGERADWQDVLQRAGVRADRRRRVALVLAGFVAAILVAVATPVGPAIAKGIGDFSAWLTGHPGTEAPASERRAFDVVNGHSWAAFPKGTQLRELIRAKVGGRVYTLSGFRSGDSLCLRLNGHTRRTRTGLSCAPTSTLSHISAPVLVLTGNRNFEDQHGHTSAMFSFGIVADGVERVEVHAVDGTHRALVGANAYLWIQSEPNSLNIVKSVSATRSDGRASIVTLPPFAVDGLAVPIPNPRVGGPTRVEATIREPTIGWAVRHEHRGLTRGQARLTSRQRSATPSNMRLFKPDPLGNIVVGLNRDGCMIVVGSSFQVCRRLAGFFSGLPAPIYYTMSRGGFGSTDQFGSFLASDQFDGIAGAVADGVAELRIYLGDGEQQSVPIQDNMFAALVPARYPMKLVMYDSERRVVGIEMFPPQSPVHEAVASTRNLHAVLSLVGPHDVKATLRIGRAVNGGQCWRVDFSTGESPFGCGGASYAEHKIRVDFLQPAGHDVFVFGAVDGRVTDHVELHFDNGDVVKARPVANHYAFAIPRAHLKTKRHFAYVVAVDRHGHRVERQGFGFRANP